MRFNLFIIFQHSLYTDIFIIFLTSWHSQNQHRSVPACSCAGCQWATSIFAIYIMILIFYYLLAFSVYWNFYYFFTTWYVQNWQWCMPACGCAICQWATGIFLLYISPGIMRFNLFIIFQHSLYTDIFIILFTTWHSQNQHQSVPACGCASCQQATGIFLGYISPGIMRFILFIIFQHSLYTDIFIIF